MERRGPHKSMHCKFCKPPGTVPPESPNPAQLEMKTKLHLSHKAADVKIFDVFDEPGEVASDSEACICQLEGYEPCPKCVPDKKRKPVKKKVCDCPLGSRPHPNMAVDTSNQKKKKEKKADDEFWWEKYDREHDAFVKEMWAAYLAQRKEDKKLVKCRMKEGDASTELMRPYWYQKLSCQQTLYLEYLSTAIRLDLDENISERTSFVLNGIGFYPRPKKKILDKCLRYCHYNTIRFLNQLWLLLQEDDPMRERIPVKRIQLEQQDLYAWNDRILMTCICHLELPNLLREIKDRLPPLPKEALLPQIPKPKYPKFSIREYETPYDEPLWRERMNWTEKRKWERLNRARAHMETKRVKIPELALVRRPSLIDARPPFLGQIEASMSFHRQKKQSKKRIRVFRKKEQQTFDSKVDVTAIAGIEASEVSTTPKADSEDICVFLRPPKSESTVEEEEVIEEEPEPEPSPQEPPPESRLKLLEGFSTVSAFIPEDPPHSDDSDDDAIPFVTPPKTGSGATLVRCPPPKGSPGPPVEAFQTARRELGLINKDLCAFDPNDERYHDDDDEEGASVDDMNIEDRLKMVAKKLKQLHLGVDDDEDEEEEEGEQTMVKEKPKKKRKKKKKKAATTEAKDKKKAEFKKKGKKTKKKKKKKVILKAEAIDEEEAQEGVPVGKQRESTECVCEGDKNKKKKKKKKGDMNGKKKKGKKGKNGTTGNKVQINVPRVENDASGSDSESGSRSKLSASEEWKEEEEMETIREVTKSEMEQETVEESSVAEEEEDKIFYGPVTPLLKTILRDLSEEGFVCAGYPNIHEHPDIQQLIKHLQGKVITEKLKKQLSNMTRLMWRAMEKHSQKRPSPPDLNVSQKRLDVATWHDKNWMTALAKKKKDIFYFSIAKSRANEAKVFYKTLHQDYFGTDVFLKAFYAYMIPMRRESIRR